MGKWEMTTVAKINDYKGKSVNPLNTPDTTYELYSVPSWDSDYPEIIKGVDIGSTKQTVNKGDVLLCKINPRINRVWVVGQHTEHPLIASSEWIVVRNKNIDSRYLATYFQSPIFRDMMVSEQSGIGGSLTRAQPKRVNLYPVPLPPLEVQRQIADVLDRASTLIEKRKTQIDKLDLLVKSQFIEMFGDPVTNPKGWQINDLKHVCTKLTDGTHFSPESYPSGDYLYVTAKNIKPGGFDFSNITYVDADVHSQIYSRCNPEYGDVLYIKDGATTGIAIVNTMHEPFTMLSSVALLKQDRNIVNGEYLCAALSNGGMYRNIRANMGGAAITRLTISKLNNILIPVPPISIQTQFANFVQQVETQKSLLQQSLSKLELNYKSLMQKCFRGEIF